MAADSIDTATRIETPEHIAFEFRLAGPWRRCWAYGVDLLVRTVFFVGLVAVSLMALAVTGFGDFVLAHAALLLLLYFALEWFYFVLFEWLWDGRTPGKKLAGLRVVKEGGYPIGASDAFLRNLLRAADFLPPYALPGFFPLPTYLLGALVSGSDLKFRRLGDLAAGTIVIVEEPARLRAPAPVEPPPTAAESQLVPPHPRLSVEEKRTLDAFLRRFRTINPARREELCETFARHLERRLGVAKQPSGARFLQLVYARLSQGASPLRRGRVS
jgi:uncharacterized RDD family membrane protein YckC